jgi:tetratricopeptide (TPR) repeat protein
MALAETLGFGPDDIIMFDEGRRSGDTWWRGGGPAGSGSRVELARLLKAAADHEITTVITYGRSRIANKPQIWDAFAAKLQEYGVELALCAPEDGLDEDATSDDASTPKAWRVGATPERRAQPSKSSQPKAWRVGKPRAGKGPEAPRPVTARKPGTRKRGGKKQPGPPSAIGRLFAGVRAVVAGPPPPPPYEALPIPDAEEMKRRCAIYVRSSRRVGTAESIEAQIARCFRAAQRLGFSESDVAIYDDGLSGGDTWWSGLEHGGSRSALGALVEAARTGYVNTIIVATSPALSHIDPIVTAFMSEVVEPNDVDLVLCDQRPDLTVETEEEAQARDAEGRSAARSAGRSLIRGIGFIAAGAALVCIMTVIAKGIVTEGRAEYRAMRAAAAKAGTPIPGQEGQQAPGPMSTTALGYYLRFVQSNLANGDLDAAIAKAVQATRTAPQDQNAAICLGMLYAAKRDVSAADKQLLAAIRLNPKNPEPYTFLASLRSDRGDAAGAEAILRQGVGAVQDPRGDIALADFYAHSGHADKACAVLKAVVAKLPGNPVIRHAYAVDLLRAGNTGGAQEQMQLLQDKFPGSGLAELLQGELDLLGNDPKAAAPALTQAITVNPHLAEAHRTLGTVYSLQGQYAKAADSYEKAIAAGAVDPLTFNELAYIYATTNNNLPAAVKLAELAVAMSPGDPHMEDTLGWALYTEGEYPRALEVLKQVAAEPKATPTHRYHFGMALLRAGDPSGYKKIQEALAAQPKAEWADSATRALNGKLD